MFVLLSGMSVMYVLLYAYLQALLNQKRDKLNLFKIIRAVLIIFVFGWAVFFGTGYMTGTEFANRILHAVGGGVLAFVAYYMAVIDADIKMCSIQFFLLGFLLVSTLGVVNELFELMLDIYTGISFAPHRLDTWFDLLSNTVGIIVSGIFLTALRHRVSK